MPVVLQSLGMHRLYCSPYWRCECTLAPLAEKGGLEVVLEEGRRERRLATIWWRDFRDG